MEIILHAQMIFVINGSKEILKHVCTAHQHIILNVPLIHTDQLEKKIHANNAKKHITLAG